jgi:hypothetical protein
LRDASLINLRRKQRIFRESRLFVSAESRWMLDRARHSVLAPAVIDWKYIPGGVDLQIFSPGSREEARLQLDLDLVAAFGAYNGTVLNMQYVYPAGHNNGRVSQTVDGIRGETVN